MNVASRGLQILRDEGPLSFAARSFGFVYRRTIRKLLPKTHSRTANGVKVERIPFSDLYLSSVLPGVRVTTPHREQGLVSAHKKFTRPGDSVVIVGGGNGVTSVCAANIVGESGRVHIYEGGREAAHKIREVTRWNGVEERCEVTHAIVGKERDVYGGEVTGADLVSPDESLECEVLELDCEGSEIDIIRHMEIEPRVLIVELHPYNFSGSPADVMNILTRRGYQVEYYAGHDGNPLTRDEFDKLVTHSDEKGDQLVDRRIASNRGQELTASGARWPVVFAATRTAPDSL